MTDVALVPERYVLERDDSIPANYAGQSAQPLVGDRVAFVRHRRAAFLAFAEKFFYFQNFSPLEMPKFRCPAINARRDHGESGHKFCMTIALHDLRRKSRRFQSEPLTHRTLDFWIDVRVRAHCATDLADANALSGLRQPFYSTTEFVIHERQLQAERDRLSVHAVTAADHRRHFVAPRLVCDCATERFQIFEKDLAGLIQLYRKRRVQNI